MDCTPLGQHPPTWQVGLGKIMVKCLHACLMPIFGPDAIHLSGLLICQSCVMLFNLSINHCLFYYCPIVKVPFPRARVSSVTTSVYD